MFVHNFISNFSILVAFLFVGHQLVKRFPRLVEPQTSLKQLVHGVMYGFLGIVLMGFGFKTIDGSLLDLRHVPIILCLIFVGAMAAFTAASLIAIARILLFGWSEAAFFAVVAIILVYIFGMILSKKVRGVWNQWAMATLFSCIILTITKYFVLVHHSLELYIGVIAEYWFFSFFGGYVSVSLITTLRRNEEILKDLEMRVKKDYLTGVHNVHYFEDSYRQLVNQSRELHQSLSLIVLDIVFSRR
ncbi:LytS/YhcK type 5TM receptor domain-containing protein [Ammoniphilus sp. YIM 78166]|uniref:LytS/YhcK type 5TM receptor domain-containing protein n=1 Tax=Ammoniphilus sp. YIM 78166 TaxID=1644106 RepID=UPI00106F3DCA|nr:LytS/YhcK type 5TM receptor domain-containing protein [Ammoniphilus sp. YIM 78166]